MACKDIKDVAEGYETIIQLIIAICTDRACTIDYIQKYLTKQEFTVTEESLTMLMRQIKEMMIFSKDHSYDIGDVVTYWRYRMFGLIYGGEKIGNEIIHVEYKKFYLYNNKRFTDDAFKEHILPELEFEELRRTVVKSKEELKKALICLDIEKNEWKNYVIVDDKNKVWCKNHNIFEAGNMTTECLGKLVKRTSVDKTNNT